MNAPGIIQENKHNHYLSDKELDAIFPAIGYAIVTPPPWICTDGSSLKAYGYTSH